MQRWIELHDSEVRSASSAADSLVINLDAYVHQWEPLDAGLLGTGWMQPVELRILAPHVATCSIAAPVRVSGGSLSTAAGKLEGLVPLPSSAAGGARLQLQLADGTSHEFRGDAYEVTAVGEARFVENLPDHLHPPA